MTELCKNHVLMSPGCPIRYEIVIIPSSNRSRRQEKGFKWPAQNWDAEVMV